MATLKDTNDCVITTLATDAIFMDQSGKPVAIAKLDEGTEYTNLTEAGSLAVLGADEEYVHVELKVVTTRPEATRNGKYEPEQVTVMTTVWCRNKFGHLVPCP